MSTKNILYIINPNSGEWINYEDVLEKIKVSLNDSSLEVIKTTGNHDSVEIKVKLSEKKWDAVLVGGGDGTIKLVAEAVAGVNIPIGIIPLGSANGLARCLAILNVEDAIIAVKTGKIKMLDTVEINEHTCLHLSDFGLNAGMIRKFEEDDERGMLSYFKNSLLQIFDMKPYSFVISINGKQTAIEARMLVIANGDKYGTGAIINPLAKMDDGKMEIIALNPVGVADMVTLSFDFFRGTIHESALVKIWQGTEAEIQNPDGAEFQIDGEIIETPKKIKITCKPRKISFFVPEVKAP
ncbi:MAG: NAD(+)/NADH kinase [Bacteroidales bacterium]|nr:NAD(+)/NADH kinase [Bacteroidales bacterium]